MKGDDRVSLKERTINVDIMTKEYTKLKYKQGDKNQVLILKMYKNGSILDLTNYVASIFYEKPNGTVLQKSCTIYENIIMTTITDDVLSKEGEVKAEVYLTEGTEISISFVISLDVEESIDKNSAVQKQEQWDAIKNLVIYGSLLPLINDDYVLSSKTWSSNKINNKINSETTNLQTQINNLVLGAVGDGNNAEVIQARGEYETLNARHEATEFKLNHINPSQNVYINGDTIFSGFKKVFERSFSGTATTNRYWDFSDWIGGMIAVEYGTFLNLYMKGYLTNVSSKLKTLQYQINWFKEDGTTSSSTAIYLNVEFDKTVNIEVPTEDTKYARIIITENLSEANGTPFVDILNIDTFILYRSGYSFNRVLFPEFKEFDNALITLDNIIETNSNPFSFLQGDIIKNEVNDSKTNIRTDFIPIDFAKAIITCPTGYIAKCLRYGKNKKYLRFGNLASNVYEFIPKEDEYYFKLSISLEDNSVITAKTFDGSSVKFEKYSTNDINAKTNEYPKFNNSMFYQDRITNKSGKYWIYKKDTDTGETNYYCEERIADILSAKGVPTIFITDTHWRLNSNSQFSWDLCGLFASRIHCNNIVMGGDVLTQHGSVNDGKCQLINEISPFVNRFNTDFKYVFGNHDLNVANVGTGIFTNSVETYRLSYETVYRTCIAHLNEIVNFDNSILIKNTEEWYRQKLHYYYDDEINRIRYIVMDSGTSKDALSEGGTPTRLQYQYDWLADVLINTPIGYHIMVIAHQFWSTDKTDPDNRTIASTTQGDNVSKILNAYQNMETISGSDSVVSFNYDFTESNGCPIIAMVSGHVHFDYTGKVNGIQQIVTVCDAVDHAQHYNVDMEAGTITEHAFDVIKVDKFTRTVRCFRIGAGEDRIFTY